MKTLSKRFYIASIIGGFAGSFILFLASMALTPSYNDAAVILGVIFLPIGFCVMIYGVVIYALFIHKMWTSVPLKYARTTPGKAVGFLFIPLFNLYWMFQAIWGWTKDFNQYSSENNICDQKMPEKIALAMCILAIVSMIPIIGVLATIAYLVLLTIFLDKSIDGVNAAIEHTAD